MGVTGLWKLVDQAGKPVPLSTLENKVLAVDISIWLHQVVKGYQDSKGNALPYAHTLGLFHRICKLLFYRIKPVFVFDGGCPELKRNVIKKRAESKNQLNTEADRIQTLLLKALAQEQIVKQALGDDAAASLIPKASPQKEADKRAEKFDIFKLPPIVDDVALESDISTTTPDSSIDEKQSRQLYNVNIGSIDVTSKHFKTLPADIRHEILIDLKETRKQSSWGRLHELPSHSDDFSEFQMKKLLKRRQVQVSLEAAEQEMGGKCMSMAELESLMSEEGILSASTSANAKRIAYDDKTRYLLVRDMKKAMEMAKVEEEAELKVKEEEAKNIEELQSMEDLEAEDYDAELQKAIQLSLTANESDVPEQPIESDVVKLNKDQKALLGDTGKSLARAYMLEYGGMNDEDIKDLLRTHEEVDTTFKHNDISVLGDVLQTNNLKSCNSPQYISSDADSDLVEVPDVEVLDVMFNKNHYNPISLESPTMNGVEMNNVCLSDVKKKGSIQLQIVLNDQQPEDDIFKDIFEKIGTEKSEISESETASTSTDIYGSPSRVKTGSIYEGPIETNRPSNSKICQGKNIIEATSLKDIEIILKTSDSQSSVNQNELITIEEEVALFPSNEDTRETQPFNTPSPLKDNLTSILNELHQEKENVKFIKLPSIDTASTTSSNVIDVSVGKSANKTQSSLDSFYDVQKTPKKTHSTSSSITNSEEIPKVVSPFYVRKTPKSQSKRSVGKTSPEGKIPSNENDNKSTKKLGASKRLFSDEINPITQFKNSKTTEELSTMADDLRQQKVILEAERNKQNRMGTSVTRTMSSDCMQLLQLFGIPYIVAPMEAEAQCAYLNSIALTDGTITDDSDIWLFGGRTVYKNFFDQNKHVMEFKSDTIEQLYNVDRYKLIQMAYLVGSDYTSGITGIGPVTAIEILAAFPSTPQEEGSTTEEMSVLSTLRKFREWINNRSQFGSSVMLGLKSKLKNITVAEGFPSKSVLDAYLYPTIDDSKESFVWENPEVESITEYTRKTFGWTRLRTDELLEPVLKKINDKRYQMSIKNYFQLNSGLRTPKQLRVSKRMQKAINHLSGVAEVFSEEPDRKKARPKKKKSKVEDESLVKSPVITRQTRKRVTATVTSHDINEPQPSTSCGIATKIPRIPVVVNKKIPKIPVTNPTIPQRQKYMESMEKNKEKAIELFNKSNATKNKAVNRKIKGKRISELPDSSFN